MSCGLWRETTTLAPFVDPKHSDGSPEQADVYDNTLRTIASEMGYIVRKILELRG